jgi:transcriptional regulator with XRE-family HTH domain
MTDSSVDNDIVRQLGAALRTQRLARGLSLRALAAQLQLSGHGTLIDYEHGRRIPPEDLLTACERVLNVPDGQLLDLRDQALAERAGQQAALLLASRTEARPAQGEQREQAVQPAQEPQPPTDHRRVITLPLPRRRSWLLVAAMVVLLATAGLTTSLAAQPPARQPAQPGHGVVRVGFERPSDDWVILYGPQVAQLRVTAGMSFEGTHALLMTVTGASASRGYSAVGTTHGIGDVRSGTKITFRLWVPGPQDGGVRFFVYDSHFRPTWAPETGQTEIHLPRTPGWSTFTWTVPRVDQVRAIGMQVWSEFDTPVLIGLDAISW